MIQVIAKLTLGFLGLSCVAFFYNKSFTIEAINEICINPRYYPKHYCTVPRWIKKHFKVKQRMIPKFLCFEFYISTFYLILGLINSVLSIVLCIKDRIDVIYALYNLRLRNFDRASTFYHYVTHLQVQYESEKEAR